MQRKKYLFFISNADCFLSVVFCLFSVFYFGDYNDRISSDFNDGLEQAIPFAKTLESEEILVDSSIFYSQVLFFDQTPTPEYLNTVEYTNYPSAFLKVSRFGKYNFSLNYDQLEQDKIYLIPKENSDIFETDGFSIEEFKNYVVAYR